MAQAQLQAKLEESVNEWQNMQRGTYQTVNHQLRFAEIERLDNNKQKLDTQLRENEMVKKVLYHQSAWMNPLGTMITLDPRLGYDLVFRSLTWLTQIPLSLNSLDQL